MKIQNSTQGRAVRKAASGPRRSKGRPSGPDESVGRAALISSTRQLLKMLPPAKVTRDEIAQFAGVNPALIRYYFGDKSGLLTAVVEEISRENLSRLRDEIAQEGSAIEKLRRRVKLLLRMHIENPYYHQLIFEQLWHGQSAEQRRLSRELVIPYFEEFRTVLQQGVKDGELAEVEPRFLHVAVIGLCELFINAPYMFKELFGVKEMKTDFASTYGDFVVDLLINGISRNGEKCSPRAPIKAPARSSAKARPAGPH